MSASCGDTSMAAVLKLNNQQVEDICAQYEHVYPVNYNCPGQLVISGRTEEIEACKSKIKEAGGRIVPLAVSGGFHSPFMSQAAKQFGVFLKEMENIAPPSLPVYANETALPYGKDVKLTMERQIDHPVHWEQLIRQMNQVPVFCCMRRNALSRRLSLFALCRILHRFDQFQHALKRHTFF